MAAKQARITLTIGKSSEGPRSTGDISVLGLGFAFYQIWLYMAVFSAPKTFHPDTLLPISLAFPEDLHALLVYIFLASSGFLLLAFSILNRKLVPFFCSKVPVFASSLLMFAGTSMLFFSGNGALVVFIASMLMGIGTAILVILFGIVFSKFDFATCVLNAGLACAIGFIGADALTNWIPAPISGVFACIMPLLLLIFFIRNMPALKGETKGEIPLRYVKPYITRLGISMLCLGFVVGALRVVCGDKLLSSGAISMELVLGVGCMVSAFVLVLAIALSKRTELWDSLLRNVTPAIMLGIAGIALLAGDAKMFAAFFTIIGFVCVVSITWILLASFAKNLNGSYIFVFGLGYGIIQAASVIGALVANLLSSQGQLVASISNADSMEIVGFTSQVGLSDLAIILMVAFSAGYAMIPRYRELKEMLVSLMVALSKEKSTVAGAEPAKPLTNNNLADNAANAEQEVKDSTNSLISATEQDENTKEDSRSTKDKKGSFTRRCDELSDQYRLSAREREAFFLLAKGHNAAYLTESLCISKSTAKTHINHIYKKLGIHTQQELLNMVEDRHRGPLVKPADRAVLQDAVRRVKEEGTLDGNPSELVSHIRQDIR